MSGLKQASLHGLRWSAITQVAGQLATYGSFVVLARLLSPAQMGLIASATLAVGLISVLNELGMGAALVQRQELTRGHEAACFWSNLAVGFILALLLAAATPLIAMFFGVPALKPVLWALAPTFPIVALGVLPRALLERNLRFKQLGLIEAGASVANGGLAMAMAFMGFGVWSVVAGSWAGFVVQAAAYWAFAGCKPGGRFEREELNELLRFGGNVLGTRVFGYVSANVDYVIVGRMMGPAALGVYSLAYKLVTMPMQRVSYIVLRVAYPAFSRLQHDDEALRRHYLTLVGTLAAVVFPLLAGLAVLAPEAISLVFGPRWAAAAVPTQLLCLVGALKALVCSIGVVFMTKGRPELEMRLNAFGALKLPVFLLIGAHWGLNGLVIAYGLSSLSGVPVQQHFANRVLGLTWGRYLGAIAPPTAAAAGMLATLALLRHQLLVVGQPAWVVLGAAVIFGAPMYLLALGACGYDWPAMANRILGRRQAPAGLAPTT